MITFNDFVTIPVIVRNQWTRNGRAVPNDLLNDATITEGLIQKDSLQYEATLYFNPLDNTDDSGAYFCNFDILSNISDYEYVRSTSANASTTIAVQGMCFIFISAVVIKWTQSYTLLFSYSYLISNNIHYDNWYSQTW